MAETTIANILSIAGSDPSGGAGIQADLKTFAARGTYGMAVLTALTAQNTQGVSGVHLVPSAFVTAQIRDVFADVQVQAVKIGMIASAEIAEAVANALAPHRGTPLVLEPSFYPAAISRARRISDSLSLWVKRMYRQLMNGTSRPPVRFSSTASRRFRIAFSKSPRRRYLT